MIVLGAGRHTKDLMTVIDLTKINSIIFFDDITKNIAGFLGKFKVITNITELSKLIKIDNGLVIGAGNLKIRRILYEKTKHLNPNYINIISNTAIIGSFNVSLGWGLNIMHQSFISNNVTIGNGTLINRSAGIHHDVIVGEFCEIGPGTNILGGVHIGHDVSIGAGAIILPDITICDNVIIGAGAVITKNIYESGTYIGIPAKLKK